MNKLTDDRRASIVRALTEGNSVRSTARLTGSAKATVLKLLVELGEFSAIYQDHAVRNLKCTRVEADEIWSYVGAKEKAATQPSQGDLWTYTAICADSKLVLSWLVGPRNYENTRMFMQDVADRLANRVQLTTDGLGWYAAAVDAAFGSDVDFAQLIKKYGAEGGEESRGRHGAQVVCIGADKVAVTGSPDMANVSTSYVERQNLSMRMGMRRFTRSTNGFSKKAENHAHAVSLYFLHYNYCRPHQTLTKAAGGIKTTPAMSAGLTDHAWTVEEILEKLNPARILR